MTTDYAARIVKSAATFLGRWRGATAHLRELTSSHQTLRIELYRASDQNECLQLACIEPSLIRAPILWEQSDVHVAHVGDAPDPYFVITDAVADVEIRCGHLELAEMPRY
jgi:hypothetical protein